MRKTKLYLIVLLSLSTFACATVPELSSMQRRQLQSRTFENTSYENVFRSFKSVLQDEGYIIKNQDMAGGLIVASIQKASHSIQPFLLTGSSQKNSNYVMDDGFELSVNLEKMNELTVESRLTIQKVEHFSQGGQQGREILDQELYKAFYEKVKVETERRKAQGKV